MAYSGPLMVFKEKTTGNLKKIDSSNMSDENQTRLTTLKDTAKYTKVTGYDPSKVRWEDIIDEDYDEIEGVSR